VTDGEIGVVAPIFDAKVEVPGTGISSTTDWNGSAKLIGVPADIEIRVIKDGFHSVVRPAQITRNGFSIGVQLFPTGPRISLTGEYRLVVSSRVCEAGGSLPESVKTRTYSAGIHEPGGKVRVLLRDGPFVIKPPASASRWGGDGNAFDGQTQVVDTLFTLIEYVPGSEDGYGIHPSVAERLPDGTVLTFSGRAVVRPAPEGFLGTLDGAIAIYNVIDSEAGTGRLLASCRSRAHGFNLLR
jgi:hypothetical protein